MSASFADRCLYRYCNVSAALGAHQPRAQRLLWAWISKLCKPGPNVDGGQRVGKNLAEVILRRPILDSIWMK